MEIINEKAQVWWTEIGKNETYIWKINNFTERSKKVWGEKIESPTFVTGNFSDYNWRLEFYPNGYSGPDVSFRAILLNDDPRKKENPTVRLGICNGDATHNLEVIEDESSDTPTSANTLIYGIHSTIILDDILDPTEDFLSSDNTLYVKIRIYTPSPHRPTSSFVKNCHIGSVYNLQNQLSRFYDNEKFSDIVIKYNGGEIKSHKLLLSARSPVFASLLDADEMKDKNEIIINDSNAHVVHQMMEFIYTDNKPSRIDEFAGDLLIISTKYELVKLRGMCEDSLIDNIDINNAVDVLIFADNCDAKKLKACCADFICKNKSELNQNELFGKLEKQNVQLALEMYRLLLQEKNEEVMV